VVQIYVNRLFDVCTVYSSTELDSINDDVIENVEEVDSDEESSVLKSCNNSQGTVSLLYPAVFLLHSLLRRVRALLQV